jgi:hypothetical protein
MALGVHDRDGGVSGEHEGGPRPRRPLRPAGVDLDATTTTTTTTTNKHQQQQQTSTITTLPQQQSNKHQQQKPSTVKMTAKP